MDALDATMRIARAVGGETDLEVILGPVARRAGCCLHPHAGHRARARLDREIGVSTQPAATVPLTLRVIEPKLMLPRVQPGMLAGHACLRCLTGTVQSR